MKQNPEKFLVLNGPHKGQRHTAQGGGTVLQLIDPTPPRRVRDFDLTDVFSPADTTYTTYALQTLGVEDGGKRDFHRFWQTQETTRSATTMVSQLLDLVGEEGAVPPHKWSYCPYCGVEAPRPGLHKWGCPAHDKGGSR